MLHLLAAIHFLLCEATGTGPTSGFIPAARQQTSTASQHEQPASSTSRTASGNPDHLHHPDDEDDNHDDTGFNRRPQTRRGREAQETDRPVGERERSADLGTQRQDMPPSRRSAPRERSERVFPEQPVAPTPLVESGISTPSTEETTQPGILLERGGVSGNTTIPDSLPVQLIVDQESTDSRVRGGGITKSTGTKSNVVSSESPLPIHDRILSIVSDQGAAAVCRIFSGLSPGDTSVSLWSSQVSWGVGSSNQPQQSQWPLLSKIVARLFWYVFYVPSQLCFFFLLQHRYYIEVLFRALISILLRCRSPKHHVSVQNALLNSTKTLVDFLNYCLVLLRQHIAQRASMPHNNATTSSHFSSDILPLDLLPPKNLREKFNVILNLFLRLTTSLQDVFWSGRPVNNQANNPTDQTSSTSQAIGSVAPSVSSTENLRPIPRTADESGGSSSNSVADASGTTVEAVPTAQPNCGTDDTGTKVAASTANSATLALEQEQIEKEKQALRHFRDFFDSAGTKSLWKVLDATLRDIEVACPSLRLQAATSIESPIPISQEAVDTVDLSANHRRASEEFGPPRRARDLLRSSRGPDAAAHSVVAETAHGSLSPPLLVNQLLSLIDCYLLIQQVGVAAELGLKASEVPRVGVTAASRGDAQLQQSFAESVSTVLLNPDARLSERHAEMLMFCERHRRILNLLIQQSPGMLSGAFQPLVALAPMCISFENKRLYFRQKLKQLREGTRQEAIRLNVRRNLVFIDSFHQLRIRSGEEMKGKLIVHFQGEEGVDAGGLTREWYAILAREMFNPDYALFR